LKGTLRNQLVLEMQQYSFNVPFGTFRHSNPNEQLEYEATQADGSPLPSWLKFDPKSLKFSGTPPQGAMNTTVKVIAYDRYGHKAYATFNVIVNKDKYNSGNKTIKLTKPAIKINRPNQAQLKEDGGLTQVMAGKLAFNEQLSSAGRLTRLQESRALLDSLSQI
jgi:hypothetical protein